jgi:hypothetical protein
MENLFLRHPFKATTDLAQDKPEGGMGLTFWVKDRVWNQQEGVVDIPGLLD